MSAKRNRMNDDWEMEIINFGENGAFLTGSHAYGKPHSRSDVDIVIPIHWKRLTEIYSVLLDMGTKNPEFEVVMYGETGNISVRSGPINLIFARREEEYKIWRNGTEELMRKKRSTARDLACRLFKRWRRMGQVREPVRRRRSIRCDDCHGKRIIACPCCYD